MGTWGVDISDNDLYKDIEHEFLELYNEGIDVNTITQNIIKKYDESLDSDEDSNNFWFAIADLQWQCKSLDEKVFDKVRDIIESKNDLELWRDLDSSESDIIKREQKLNKFLIKISTVKKTAKKRIKKKLYNSIFKKGDCLVFKLENGKYGGALVIDDEENTEYGLNLIAISNLEKEQKPNLNDLKKASLKYYSDGRIIEEYYYPRISYFYAKFYSEESIEMEISVIGSLKIKNKKLKGSSWMHWESLTQIWDVEDKKIKTRLKISDFIEETSFFNRIKNWL